MTQKILTDAVFRDTIIAFFNPEEIIQIAGYILPRISDNSQRILSDEAKNFNTTPSELLAFLLERKTFNGLVDLLSDGERETFQELAKYLSIYVN